MSPSNRKQTDGWIRVADSALAVESKPVVLHVEGQALLLVRYQGEPYLVQDRCPHRDAPLHKGDIEDGCVVCPLHGWAFDLATGEGATVPGTSIRTFQVKEVEGGVFIRAKPPAKL